MLVVYNLLIVKAKKVATTAVGIPSKVGMKYSESEDDGWCTIAHPTRWSMEPFDTSQEYGPGVPSEETHNAEWGGTL